MTSKNENETNLITKRSYSYGDIMKMQNDKAYTSLGMTLSSKKPSAPRATFGLSERSNSKKLAAEKDILKVLAGGKQGNGPAAYLPSTYREDGEIKQRPDISNNLKYNSNPSFSIGKSERKRQENPVYHYMHSKNDKVDINEADLKQRNSSPMVRIGTNDRFPKEREDKITPGPTYDAVLPPHQETAPSFSLGSRRRVKGSDPLIPQSSTTSLVGPSTYFQKMKKSHSSNSLNRVPYDSKIKNQPVVSFTKGPKTLATYKNSTDQTYDLKTKTIMAHYDFQYDAGKGLNSGKAWQKKTLLTSSQIPLEKNKMKSYTLASSTRQKQQKRGVFASSMVHAPPSIKIAHPKF